MKKLILIPFVFFGAIISHSQHILLNNDEQKLIKAIYPSYNQDVADSGWVNYFDQEFKATIIATQMLQFSEEQSSYLVIFTWKSIDYTYGEMVEFYEIEQTNNEIVILAKPSDNSGRIYYGGGTQRYGDVEVRKNIKFSDNKIHGFEVQQGSYHFASGTEEETLYLFAIINKEIREVLSLNSFSGFSAFNLKEIKESAENSQIQDLIENIETYVPQEYMRDDISESESNYEVINTQTNGMCDIKINSTTYSLSDNKIDKKVIQYLLKWNGVSYNRHK